MRKPRYRGFTLVELLVVISIVAVLTGLTATFLPKALKKGAQTKSVAGMRQMASAFRMHAQDHANRLPPVVTRADESEAGKDTYWYIYLEQRNSSQDLGDYFKDKWWKENKTSIYINPMLPKKNLTHKSTGYAMNSELAYNVATSRGDKMDPADSKYTAVNLNSIPNETVTPMVVPHWSWSYKLDKKEAGDTRFAPFLVNGSLPVLFLDSHIETLTPKQYVAKGLNLVPKSEDDK